MSHTYTKYEELDESAGDIRLLVLLPPSGASKDEDEIISCSLEKVRLADANPFYALSYVWGADGASQRVLVDGEIVLVRSNLAAFLREVRRLFCRQAADTVEEGRSIRVWADSICIDQSNLLERSSQVSIIGDIFREADAVCAWLGEASEPLEVAFQHLAEVSRMRSQNQRWMDISAKSSLDIGDIESIASSSYWSRMWIKQEVILARDVWFVCGSHLVTCADLRFAALNCRESGQPAPKRRLSSTHAFLEREASPASAMNALLDLRGAGSTNLSLSQLVDKFRAADCLDARDRIYACLSLTDEDTRRDIKVDYRLPLFRVLLDSYCHWSGDEQGPERSPVIFEYGSFCSQMARMLPEKELRQLVKTKEARNCCDQNAIFVASAPVDILAVAIFAHMDERKINPAADVQGHSGVVLRLITKPPGRLGCARQRERWVFATTVPKVGDSMVQIGPRVCFLRQEGQDNTDRVWMIVGNGTEMLRSVGAKNEMPHPCRWKRSQLPDAIFTLVSCGEVGTDDPFPRSSISYGRVLIGCNTAAMVTLMMESGKFDLEDTESLRAADLQEPGVLDAATAPCNERFWASRQSAFIMTDQIKVKG